MQRFGLSDLIGAVQEEASSSQIEKSSCSVLCCASIFQTSSALHIHLALLQIILFALSGIVSFHRLHQINIVLSTSLHIITTSIAVHSI